MMDSQGVQDIVHRQKQMVRSGVTKSVDFRLKQLEILKSAIKKREKDITDALFADLGKAEFEAYATEIGTVYDSISHAMKHLRKWAKPQRVPTPIVHFGSTSYIYSEPYGSVLIIGPYNYPFMLVMDPLIGAISAGNCAVVKPSEYTPHVSAILADILADCFDETYIMTIEGGKEITSILIHTPFDLIFFTGSIGVGKIVMEAAASNLVPVILELGGKSPCIVDRETNIDLAAKRIVWGKFLNTGQTCVAPDYVLAHRDIKEALIVKMKEQITAFYGADPKDSRDYGKIVNTQQWDRLNGLLDPTKVVAGGNGDRDNLYFAPTIMNGVNWNDKVMEEEIFGPILPVLEYDDLSHVIDKVNARPKPLALYLFTENKSIENKVLESVTFGGGCVNDTILHLASPYLPFGGVGSSGMGSYHGKHSFDSFSHRKSVLKKSTRIHVDLIFPPHNNQKLKWIKRFMK
ncbi:Aldehyde dehydrogenase [compost metagenome]